ncbi:MAG: 3-hydroxyacyl-CoA dehydrogenase [Eubacteriales bacterium]|nr:3-hydroxyacyl-CoA dehydrogenase [Eubacteriales bacterium]
MEKRKVTIIGGGVLGSQIALITAFHGYDVTIWLRSEGSIGRTQPKLDLYSEAMLRDLEAAKAMVGHPDPKTEYPRAMITDLNGLTVEKIDELKAQAKQRFAENLHFELDMATAVKDAYIVIETMSENPQAKIGVYEQMRDLLNEDTILCTNTSTYLPSMFAEYTGKPEKYLSLHFANTIWKNNTAEVMRHAGTSDAAFNEVVTFAKSIGMIALKLNKEQPGYLLNSLLIPLLDAAQSLWARGIADPIDIDKAWIYGTGAPKGPFGIMDIVGFETVYNIVSMHPDAQKEGTVKNIVAKLFKEKIDKGETGINSGIGFYDYRK